MWNRTKGWKDPDSGSGSRSNLLRQFHLSVAIAAHLNATGVPSYYNGGDRGSDAETARGRHGPRVHRRARGLRRAHLPRNATTDDSVQRDASPAIRSPAAGGL